MVKLSVDSKLIGSLIELLRSWVSEKQYQNIPGLIEQLAINAGPDWDPFHISHDFTALIQRVYNHIYGLLSQQMTRQYFPALSDYLDKLLKAYSSQEKGEDPSAIEGKFPMLQFSTLPHKGFERDDYGSLTKDDFFDDNGENRVVPTFDPNLDKAIQLARELSKYSNQLADQFGVLGYKLEEAYQGGASEQLRENIKTLRTITSTLIPNALRDIINTLENHLQPGIDTGHETSNETHNDIEHKESGGKHKHNRQHDDNPWVPEGKYSLSLNNINSSYGHFWDEIYSAHSEITQRAHNLSTGPGAIRLHDDSDFRVNNIGTLDISRLSNQASRGDIFHNPTDTLNGINPTNDTDQDQKPHNNNGFNFSLHNDHDITHPNFNQDNTDTDSTQDDDNNDADTNSTAHNNDNNASNDGGGAGPLPPSPGGFGLPAAQQSTTRYSPNQTLATKPATTATGTEEEETPNEANTHSTTSATPNNAGTSLANNTTKTPVSTLTKPQTEKNTPPKTHTKPQENTPHNPKQTPTP